MIDPKLSDLLVWAQERLGDLAGAATEAIIAEIPYYRDESLVPRLDLRQSTERNVGLLLKAIADPDGPHDLSGAMDTGRRRGYQGLPLTEVIHAYRVAYFTVWDMLEAQARHFGAATRESLLGAVSTFLRLSDENNVALSESYRAAAAERMLTQHERRSALVEGVLTGQSGMHGSPLEAAELLGLPPRGRFMVVTADTKRLAEEGLPGVERRLSTAGVVSAWRLTPLEQMGIIALRDNADDAIRLLRECATGRTGVSPEFDSLIDTPRALQLARSALARVPADHSHVEVFSADPIDALIARAPSEGRRLAKQILGPLLDLAIEERRLLVQTLSVYFAHGGSADSSAKVLHCHANTVRYRLRRIQDLTGRSLSNPRDTAALATAVSALAMNSEL